MNGKNHGMNSILNVHLVQHFHSGHGMFASDSGVRECEAHGTYSGQQLRLRWEKPFILTKNNALKPCTWKEALVTNNMSHGVAYLTLLISI